MSTEMGELLVGAYLKLEEGCHVVDYNVRPPGGGLEGLGELDVVGYDFATGTAFLCEVTTHIKGLLIGSYQKTIEKITQKHQRQRAYAAQYLTERFPTVRYQFWSPCVPKGYLTDALLGIEGLEVIVNGAFREKVNRLQGRARTERQNVENPAFRLLQILEAMRSD